VQMERMRANASAYDWLPSTLPAPHPPLIPIRSLASGAPASSPTASPFLLTTPPPPSPMTPMRCATTTDAEIGARVTVRDGSPRPSLVVVWGNSASFVLWLRQESLRQGASTPVTELRKVLAKIARRTSSGPEA